MKLTTLHIDPLQCWVDLVSPIKWQWTALNILLGILWFMSNSEYALTLFATSAFGQLGVLTAVTVILRRINARLEESLKKEGLTDFEPIGRGLFFATLNDERVKGEFVRIYPMWIDVLIEPIP